MKTGDNVLFAIADSIGPDKYLIALGYAGWEAGQLEAELAELALDLGQEGQPHAQGHHPARGFF